MSVALGAQGDWDWLVILNDDLTFNPDNLASCLSTEHLDEFDRAFADEALETVADLAMQRKVGARGLRMILEDLMLELMYHLPAQRKLREFVVTAEMVRSREINWSLLEKAG